MSDFVRNWIVDDLRPADGRPGTVQLRAVDPDGTGGLLYMFVPATDVNMEGGSGLSAAAIDAIEAQIGTDAAAQLRSANEQDPSKISIGDAFQFSGQTTAPAVSAEG